MPNIQRIFTPGNPLMQPVQHNGQDYFTSQYFHQQYLANSPHGGKYRQHSHFVRVLRSIETYGLYREQGAIVEIKWGLGGAVSASDGVGIPFRDSYRYLFQAAGWNLITLLNATAQAALSHHLDDELSKQMSVAINTTVARQASRRTTDLLPDELATRKLSARLDAGKLLGVPLHIAQQEAVKAVHADTGVDYRPLLLAAPAQDNIALDTKMLEPMDLANEFGWGRTIQSGARMNKHLEALGWQVKNIAGKWEPTPLGQTYCAAHAWTERGHSGYNYKWRLSAVKQSFQTGA